MEDEKQGIKKGSGTQKLQVQENLINESNQQSYFDNLENKETNFLSENKLLINSRSPANQSQKSLISLLSLEKSTLIVDSIVETLHFTGFHMATLFVCIFSMMCDGYLTFHMKMGQQMMIKKFNWTKENVNVLYCLQLGFMGLGSLVSTNTRSVHWDVTSNVLLGAIGSLILLMISFYSEAIIYAFLLLNFCVCHGFIQDICTNYLLELMNIKLRGFIFLLVSSFRILGTVFGVGILLYLYGSYQVADPGLLLIAMSAFQIGLTVSLIYLLDSPRVLFYNGGLNYMYEYIQVITTENHDTIYNQQFKAQLISKLDSARREIEFNYGNQSSEGFIMGYVNLFKKPHLKITFRAMAFIFLTIIFMTLITNSHEYFYIYYKLDSNSYLFSFSNLSNISANAEKEINYGLLIYYSAEFAALILLSLIYYYLPNLKRIYFNLTTLSICTITMITIFIVKNHFVYLIWVFETFSYFYFLLIYLYLTENTTTKQRNFLTGVMFMTMQMTLIMQFYSVNAMSKINPTTAVYMNFGIVIALVLMEFFAIYNKRDSKSLNLQEIELNILKNNK
jgi:hypothetical protein